MQSRLILQLCSDWGRDFFWPIQRVVGCWEPRSDGYLLYTRSSITLSICRNNSTELVNSRQPVFWGSFELCQPAVRPNCLMSTLATITFRPPAGKVYQQNENRAWSQVRAMLTLGLRRKELQRSWTTRFNQGMTLRKFQLGQEGDQLETKIPTFSSAINGHWYSVQTRKPLTLTINYQWRVQRI